MVEPKDDCPKCHGHRQIKKPDGSISICFECLTSGRLDQHDKKVKSQSELGVKIY
jgi:DnaJ-class molecular chaperone